MSDNADVFWRYGDIGWSSRSQATLGMVEALAYAAKNTGAAVNFDELTSWLLLYLLAEFGDSDPPGDSIRDHAIEVFQHHGILD